MIKGVYLRERKANRLQRRSKLLVAIIIALIIYKVIMETFSTYRSQAESTAPIDVAIYIFEEEDITQGISLGSFAPGDTKDVKFTVANYHKNDAGIIDRTSEVDMSYTLTITTTTNLPLDFELYVNDDTKSNPSAITKRKIITDSDATIFQNLAKDDTVSYAYEGAYTKDVPRLDSFILTVTFPNDPEYSKSKYAELFDAIELNLESQQVIN